MTQATSSYLNAPTRSLEQALTDENRRLKEWLLYIAGRNQRSLSQQALRTLLMGAIRGEEPPHA